MSSILKALKKIEEESPAPQTFPTLPKPIDPKQALNAKTRKRWRLRKLIAFGLILLVIAVAAVVLFSRRQLIIAKILPDGYSGRNTEMDASKSDNSKVYRAKISTPAAKSPQRPPLKTRRLPQKTPSMKTEGNETKFQAATRSDAPSPTSGQPIPKSSGVEQPPKAELKAPVKKPLKKTLPPADAASPPPTISPERLLPAAPAAGTNKTAAVKPRETYDRIDDSKLKLQALAWSDEVTKRMAVINGRIVREGESVDGYRVIEIREEVVVVNEDGKSWLLEFGLRQ